MKLLIKAYGKKNIAELTPKKVLVTSSKKKPYWMQTYIRPDRQKSIYDNLRIEINKEGEEKPIYLYPSGPIKTEKIQRLLEGNKVLSIGIDFKNKEGEYEPIMRATALSLRSMGFVLENEKGVTNTINYLVNRIRKNFLLKFKKMGLPFHIEVVMKNEHLGIDLNGSVKNLQNVYHQIEKNLRFGDKINSIIINERKSANGEPYYRPILAKENLDIRNTKEFEEVTTQMVNNVVQKSV